MDELLSFIANKSYHEDAFLISAHAGLWIEELKNSIACYFKNHQ
jgi:hypothetical protein